MGVTKHSAQFMCDSFLAYRCDLRVSILNSFERFGFDRELIGCGDPNGSQHPKAVFFNTLQRITNCANQLCGQIGLPVDKIDHPALSRIVEHAVDRKVTPSRVFLW